jgi:hypothetical protein
VEAFLAVSGEKRGHDVDKIPYVSPKLPWDLLEEKQRPTLLELDAVPVVGFGGRHQADHAWPTLRLLHA